MVMFVSFQGGKLSNKNKRCFCWPAENWKFGQFESFMPLKYNLSIFIWRFFPIVHVFLPPLLKHMLVKIGFQVRGIQNMSHNLKPTPFSKNKMNALFPVDDIHPKLVTSTQRGDTGGLFRNFCWTTWAYNNHLRSTSNNYNSNLPKIEDTLNIQESHFFI